MFDLMWQHITGDVITGPCIHPVVQHPSGDTIYVPCIHPKTQQHPGGDQVTKLGVTVTVPCVHWVSPHPNGDPKTIPCTHVGVAHPAGDTVTVPCVHPMLPVNIVLGGRLTFFTNNAALQQVVMDGVNRLMTVHGIDILSPRPLLIFNHDWVPGFPQDDSNPAWSHYNPLTHSIQITANLTGDQLRDTVFHEMGHALVGQQCIQIASLGGRHNITDVLPPGLAMSEGWADFVSLAITNYDPTVSGPIKYMGGDWETMNISPNPNIEYCVGCFLWDLFDAPVRRRVIVGRLISDIPQTEGGADTAQFSFKELFKVFSPTLATLPNGPVIQDIGNFIIRLKANNPGKAAEIDKVKVLNLG